MRPRARSSALASARASATTIRCVTRQVAITHDTPGAPAPHLTYRPGIDGLRAIAVLSVVLYHFGVPGLRGGFVGVDVFFVISGFLIGGLLWKERQSTGRVALGAFWMRRVRRLAPAYFAMAIVTSAAAWLVLLPFELRGYGESLIAATTWLSNVQFWRESGYFDAGSDSKPLLHTWSLSVEEQFYVVLPLLVAALGALQRGLARVLAALWVLSLVACVALTPTEPVATFFLFPFRAWEMLTGVLLAIWMREAPPTTPRAVPTWVPLVGLAIVLTSIAVVVPRGFPGWQAMLPVAGTAMILAGQDSGGLAVRLLSLRAPVAVGLVSYSLYLWHWPVLVLSTYWRESYAGWWEAALWLALAIVLTVVGWALVERPLRHARIASPRFLAGAALTAIVVLACGSAAYLTDGMPSRFSPAVQGHVAASQDFLQDLSRCSTSTDGPLAGIDTCAVGPEGEPPRVLLWGDSHMRAQMNGLARAAMEAGVPGILIRHAGCPPLFGVRKTESAATPAADATCYHETEVLRRGLRDMPSLERVLLVGRWSYYAESSGVGIDADNRIAIRPAEGSGYVETDPALLYAEALRATVAELTEVVGPVSVLRQVPEVPQYSSRRIARALAHGRLDDVTVAPLLVVEPDALAARARRADAPQLALAQAGAITLIDPRPLLCGDGRCSVMRDGRPIYFDNNHLTNAGAVALRGLFVPFLRGQAGP